jgi:hypothetical protein
MFKWARKGGKQKNNTLVINCLTPSCRIPDQVEDMLKGSDTQLSSGFWGLPWTPDRRFAGMTILRYLVAGLIILNSLSSACPVECLLSEMRSLFLMVKPIHLGCLCGE